MPSVVLFCRLPHFHRRAGRCHLWRVLSWEEERFRPCASARHGKLTRDERSWRGREPFVLPYDGTDPTLNSRLFRVCGIAEGSACSCSWPALCWPAVAPPAKMFLRTAAATITVVFGQARTSPVPSLLPYYCGGWATDITPSYIANGVVNVSGKFTQTDNHQNPVGVAGALATPTILWPDARTQTITATTSDGLATFPIPLQASAINHIVVVSITFVKGNVTCRIPQPAFFPTIRASPTPPAPSPTPCHRHKCGPRS